MDYFIINLRHPLTFRDLEVDFFFKNPFFKSFLEGLGGIMRGCFHKQRFAFMIDIEAQLAKSSLGISLGH